MSPDSQVFSTSLPFKLLYSVPVLLSVLLLYDLLRSPRPDTGLILIICLVLSAITVPRAWARVILDEDDRGNLTSRVRYPSGEANDRRGDDAWLVDARIARHFPFGRFTLSVELAAENLLGNDREIVEGYSETVSSQLRRPGRQMEAGLVLGF